MKDKELNSLKDVNDERGKSENNDTFDGSPYAYRPRIDWNYESERKNISINFMRKYAKFLNWGVICVNRELAEETIREFWN